MFLESIDLGGPYQELAVCKYAIVPTTIGRTCLKITKTRFGYISGYPTHYKCYYIKLNVLILLESYC